MVIASISTHGRKRVAALKREPMSARGLSPVPCCPAEIYQSAGTPHHDSPRGLKRKARYTNPRRPTP